MDTRSPEAESFARKILSETDQEMQGIVDRASKDILRELNELRLEDNPDYNPYWREESPKPDLQEKLQDKLRSKWAKLKQGLTSEEAQEFALMVAYLGSCYAAGWAINRTIAYIYNKIQQDTDE